MDIQSLDLNELENSASFYWAHIEKSKDQGAPVQRSVMDGIFPVLEAISSGQIQALFKSAMDAKKLSVAALLCEPPALGISFPLRTPGDLVNTYDATHPGKAFRAVCVRFAEKNYPLIVADVLSREIGSTGQSYGPSVLIKNGISELSTALARANFGSDNQSIEHRFASNLLNGGELGFGDSFSQLADLITREMFSAHLNEGRFHKSAKFFKIIESLSGSSIDGNSRAAVAFQDSVVKELTNASSNNVELIIALLLSNQELNLDRYRLAAIKAVDESLDLSDYLKASFKVTEKLIGVGKYMESISEVYIEAGYAALTEGIKDSSDYHALADIPNVDMSKISLKDIPRQARGAAIEIGLGL